MKTHPAIQSVLCGTSLSAMDMESAVLEIMNGQWTAVQIAAFLTALRMKRETVAELTGAVRAMKSRAKSVTVNQPRVLDTCGTGGDGANTFNISNDPTLQRGHQFDLSLSRNLNQNLSLSLSLNLSPDLSLPN